MLLYWTRDDKVFMSFCRFPPDLLRKLSTDCLVMQNHQVSVIWLVVWYPLLIHGKFDWLFLNFILLHQGIVFLLLCCCCFGRIICISIFVHCQGSLTVPWNNSALVTKMFSRSWLVIIPLGSLVGSLPREEGRMCFSFCLKLDLSDLCQFF